MCKDHVSAVKLILPFAPFYKFISWCFWTFCSARSFRRIEWRFGISGSRSTFFLNVQSSTHATGLIVINVHWRMSRSRWVCISTSGVGTVMTSAPSSLKCFWFVSVKRKPCLFKWLRVIPVDVCLLKFVEHFLHFRHRVSSSRHALFTYC